MMTEAVIISGKEPSIHLIYYAFAQIEQPQILNVEVAESICEATYVGSAYDRMCLGCKASHCLRMRQSWPKGGTSEVKFQAVLSGLPR